MNTSARLADVRAFRAPAALAVLASLVLLAGCASIMHGTTQQIAVSSAPTGAGVRTDEAARGDGTGADPGQTWCVDVGPGSVSA